jgi:hypothetical protein
VAIWADVERVGLSLPEAALGTAHEGSPALLVRSQQFARLRLDDEHERLQVWVSDTDLVSAHVEQDPQTFASATGYSRTVVMARLDRLDPQLMRELLVESWAARAPAGLRKANPDLR